MEQHRSDSYLSSYLAKAHRAAHKDKQSLKPDRGSQLLGPRRSHNKTSGGMKGYGGGVKGGTEGRRGEG
jgi:hypothetical protein